MLFEDSAERGSVLFITLRYYYCLNIVGYDAGARLLHSFVYL